MTKTRGFRALIALLSTGWLVPMWLGLRALLDFLDLEVSPRLLGRPVGNSFPFIDFARECFAVGFAWLALVVLGWAWVGVGTLRRG